MISSLEIWAKPEGSLALASVERVIGIIMGSPLPEVH
jgi:hypothetical protein